MTNIKRRRLFSKLVYRVVQ